MSIYNRMVKLLDLSYKVKPNYKTSYVRIAEKYMDKGVICIDPLKSNNDKIIIYSAGIGDQINFELDLLNRLQQKDVELYAFDPTPKSLEFMKNQNLPNNFHVLPYAISNKDQTLEFSLPKEDGWISGSAEDVKQDSRNFDFENKIKVDGRCLSSIMRELGHSRIDFLKMDIEGSEFDALDSAFDSKLDITQMCVDIHPYMLKNGKEKLKTFLKNLNNAGYGIYYSSPDGNECIGCIRK